MDGLDRIILDRIIGWDYWILYLDGFFFTQNLTWPGPQGHSSQGCFFVLLVPHILKNGNKLLKNLISGPDFLKNDDIWSDLII